MSKAAVACGLPLNELFLNNRAQGQEMLEQSLPNIPVPLRYGERDAVLQLQSLVDQCYQDGRYYRVDYRGEPYGDFDEALTQWINERLQKEGHRPS